MSYAGIFQDLEDLASDDVGYDEGGPKNSTTSSVQEIVSPDSNLNILVNIKFLQKAVSLALSKCRHSFQIFSYNATRISFSCHVCDQATDENVIHEPQISDEVEHARDPKSTEMEEGVIELNSSLLLTDEGDSIEATIEETASEILGTKAAVVENKKTKTNEEPLLLHDTRLSGTESTIEKHRLRLKPLSELLEDFSQLPSFCSNPVKDGEDPMSNVPPCVLDASLIDDSLDSNTSATYHPEQNFIFSKSSSVSGNGALSMHQVPMQGQNLLYPQYQSFLGQQQTMGVSYRPHNSIQAVDISQPMPQRRVHAIRAPTWHPFPTVSSNGSRYLPFPNTIASMKQTNQIQVPSNIQSAHQYWIQSSQVYLKHQNQIIINQRQPVPDQTLYSRIQRFQTAGANLSGTAGANLSGPEVNSVQVLNTAITSNINQLPEYTWSGEGSVPMANDERRY